MLLKRPKISTRVSVLSSFVDYTVELRVPPVIDYALTSHEGTNIVCSSVGDCWSLQIPLFTLSPLDWSMAAKMDITARLLTRSFPALTATLRHLSWIRISSHQVQPHLLHITLHVHKCDAMMGGPPRKADEKT